MERKTFKDGMIRLTLAHPGLNPTPESQDFWLEILADLSDWQFEESILKICRTVRSIHPNDNLAALIREHAPAIPKDMASEKELADFLEGKKDVRGIVNAVNPGVWDPHWVQSDISCDPDSPPEERCAWCGNYVEYYWVKEPYLFRRWGQKRPFWLRVGCPGCDEGKGQRKQNMEWAEEALREGK
jgi:hypothetical protein